MPLETEVREWRVERDEEEKRESSERKEGYL